MKKLLTFILLLIASPSWAVMGALTPAANPPQPFYVVSTSGIPFIKLSSGTMGNNCAISALTALPRTFSDGAYVYIKAGQISAGTPAGWYWFVASTTQAGTCYNNTYTSGTPVAPVSPTAFSTTAVGLTGETSQVTAISLTIPGGMMGINGRLDTRQTVLATNNANVKNIDLSFGGSSYTIISSASAATVNSFSYVQNTGGVTNRQLCGNGNVSSANAAGSLICASDLTIDTSAAVTLNFRLTAATATDNIIIENYVVEVRPGNTP